MGKQLLKLKAVRLLNVDGQEYLCDALPSLVASYYKGELIDQILRMKKKTPLSFHRALNMASDARCAASKEGRSGHEPHHSYWHYSHFLEFISELGFHIELTGEEFESPASNVN